MERVDNLSVVLIPDKEQFLQQIVKTKESIDNVISLDIIDYEATTLNNLSAVEILSQSSNENSEYVWIRKIHS